MDKEEKPNKFAELKNKITSKVGGIKPSFSFLDKIKILQLFNRAAKKREINLVPDVKNEMIKTLKLRNFIFFLCIVIAIGSVSLVAAFATIAAGQQMALESKKGTINNLSAKIDSFADLSDYLTIRDQINNINTLADNKQVFSRTFNILSALIPTGQDTITISQVDVDLDHEAPYLNFSAQADSGTPPYIDYNVLDSFKKSMDYMRYDYGEYVDKEGNEIPAYCIVENGEDGATLSDDIKGFYAYWNIKGEGCNPSETLTESDYDMEEYNGHEYVRIWRTPQFASWYKEKYVENKPYMDEEGNISNVEHFESQCISYSAVVTHSMVRDESTYDDEDEYEEDNSNNTVINGVTWTETNDECKLVPTDNQYGGIIVSDSSNGRNDRDGLVLRFTATIYITPIVYNFNNHHVLAFAPTGHHNVTDSYVQIQGMFAQRAADCDPNDVTCQNLTTTNSNTDSRNLTSDSSSSSTINSTTNSSNSNTTNSTSSSSASSTTSNVNTNTNNSTRGN